VSLAQEVRCTLVTAAWTTGRGGVCGRVWLSVLCSE
jgi:hypothetical protein